MNQSTNKRLVRTTAAAMGHLEVVAPPRHTVRLELTSGEGPVTWISYERHPAYMEFVASTALFGKLTALAVFLKYLAVVLAKRLVAYELIPAHLRRPRSLSAARELVRHVLGNMFQRRRSGAARAGYPEAEPRILENLRWYGCSVLVVPADRLEAIAQASQSSFAELRRARGSKEDSREFMESRTRVLMHSGSSLFEAIDGCFRDCGVFHAASAYLGRDIRLVDVNPQINDRSDDFWRHVYPDINSTIPRTAYLHKDASGGDVKVMIYLSDVGPTNGPFSFVLNSHSCKRSQRGDWVEETNDYAGLSGTDRTARARFAGLPKRLRRKCAFGNDIEDANPVSRRLIESEWAITGRRGTVVVFDPKGFHRGGMVEEGERLVITCTIG